MTKRPAQDEGFTLVEILLALTVFAIGLLAVAKLQVATLRGNAKAAVITTGTAAAQEMIEDLLTRNYDTLDDRDGDGTGQDLLKADGSAGPDGVDDDGGNFGLDDLDALADGSETSDDGRFTFFWNVAVDHPAPGSKTVKVIACWQERGVTRQVSYQFVRGNVENL